MTNTKMEEPDGVDIIYDDDPESFDEKGEHEERPEPPRTIIDTGAFKLVCERDHDHDPSGTLYQVIDIEAVSSRLPDGRLDDQGIAAIRRSKNKNPKKRAWNPIVTCVRMYCREKDTGKSVIFNTYGFYPKVKLLTGCNVDDSILAAVKVLVERDIGVAVLDAKKVIGYAAYPYSEYPYEFIELTLETGWAVRQFSEYINKAETLCIDSAHPEVKVLPYNCFDSVEEFQTIKGVRGFGWITTVGTTKTSPENAKTFYPECEWDVNIDGIRAVEGEDSVAPLRLVCYDIECGKNGVGFPIPQRDPIILIACIFAEYSSTGSLMKKRKVIFQYGSSDQLKNIDESIGDVHYRFPDEAQQLEAFGQLLRSFDPDFVVGYNSNDFDTPYVVTRAHTIGGCESATYVGKRGYREWKLPREVIKVRKNGDARTTKVTNSPGRIQLDVLVWLRSLVTFKPRSYKLGYVASIMLGDTKEDVGYSMIMPMWKTSDTTRARLAKYCLKDSELTFQIMEHGQFCMVMNAIESSRQTRVCANKLLRSGVQVKIWLRLMEKAAKPNFDEQGTPVFLPSEEGKARDKDDKFRGAEVLEPSRGFYTDWVGCGDFRSLYPSIIILLNICYTTELKYKNDWEGKAFRQAPTGTKFVVKESRLGLLPMLEIELMADRDKAKKEMALASDPDKKRMFNSRQNELKVQCNSVYGFMTASGGKLARMELGEAVTSQGRLMIMQAKGIAEKMVYEDKSKNDVIYGDSVVGDTPLFIKRGMSGLIEIVRIDDLFETLTNTCVARPDGKFECALSSKEEGQILVWSDFGWTPIRRIIRHEYSGDIMRVLTNTGVVDCTQDHGLVRADGTRVSPGEVFLGDKLMHAQVQNQKDAQPCGITLDGAWAMGAALGNKCIGEKLVPPCILNTNLDVVANYIKGYLFEKGIEPEFVQKDKITVAALVYLYQRLGYDVSIEDWRDEQDVFRVSIVKTNDDASGIKRIYPIRRTNREQVYDLETDSHHFHVGPGNLIVHNTDSIFIKFPQTIKTKAQAYERLVELCDAVNKTFEEPVMLQPEKVIERLLMVNKKKYIAALYMSPKQEKAKIDTKGIETARRDNCKMVVDCMNKVVEKIMLGGDMAGAVTEVESVLRDLFAGKLDIGQLVVSKSISKAEYKSVPVHVKVANKMKLRDPSYECGLAERIPYVMVANGAKTAGDKGEDPLWAIKHGIPLDYNYYVENQFSKPVARIFMWIFGDADSKEEMNKLEEEIRSHNAFGAERFKAALKKRQLALQESVRAKFFGPAALAKFPKKIMSTAHKKGCIDSFFKRDGPKAAASTDIEDLKAQAAEAKAKCDKCRGFVDEGEEVKCVQKDCPTLYKRASLGVRLAQEKI